MSEEPSKESQVSREPCLLQERNQHIKQSGSSRPEIVPQEPSLSLDIITMNTEHKSSSSETPKCKSSIKCQESNTSFSSNTPSTETLQTNVSSDEVKSVPNVPDLQQQYSDEPTSSHYEVLSLEIPCIPSPECVPSPEKLVCKEEKREDSPMFTIDGATGNFSDFFSIQQPELIIIDDDEEEVAMSPCPLPEVQLDPATSISDPDCPETDSCPAQPELPCFPEKKPLDGGESSQGPCKIPPQPTVHTSKIPPANPPNTHKAECIFIDLVDDDEEEMAAAKPPPCVPASHTETQSTPSTCKQRGSIYSDRIFPVGDVSEPSEKEPLQGDKIPLSQPSSPNATAGGADSVKQTTKRSSTEPPACPEPPAKKIAVPVSRAAESTIDFVELCLIPGDVVRLLPRRPSPMFAGRMSEQMTLVAALDHQDASHLVDVALTGQPGVGKTELLLQVLDANADNFDNILWLDASSNKTLENSIMCIAKKLGGENLKNVSLHMLIQKFDTVFYNKKTVIVFDNARNPIELTDYLPSRVIKGYNLFFVVASQYTEWDCSCQISLKKLTASDSKEFLKHYLPQCRSQDAREVGEILGHLPLALHAAVMYVKYKQKVLQFKQEEYNLRSFITELNTNPVDFLDHKFKNNTDISMFYASIIEKLQNTENTNAAMFLLNLMTYSEVSSYDMMLDLISDRDEKLLQDSLLFLKENSLIENEGHKILMNSVLKIYVKTKCQSEKNLYQVLNAFKCKFKIEPNCSNKFIHCLMKVWHYASKCELLVREFRMLPRVVVHSDQISPQEKLEFIESSIECLEKFVGWHNSDDLLYFQIEKAFLLIKCKHFEKASNLCNTILKLDVLEKNMKLYYFVISMKSNCYQELNKLEESFLFVKCCFEQTLNKYGGSDATADKLLKLLCTISEKLSAENKFETWQQVLSLVSKRAMLKDADHEQTLEIINTIKESLLKFERGSKVLILYERLYSALVPKFGKHHHLTLKTLFYKALCLYDLNRLDESWEAFFELITIQFELEQNVTETLAKMCAVACKLGQAGKLEPWNTWFNWTHNTVLDVLADCEASLQLLLDASASMVEAGKIDEAETLFDQLHSTLTLKLGDEDPLTLQCLLAKAECLCKVHNVDKAWDVYVKVCTTMNIEPVNKPDVAEDLLDVIQNMQE